MLTFSRASLQAEITAFKGITLRDAWIEISRDCTFRESDPTVLVVGSALEFEGASRGLASQSELQRLCQKIAQVLADLRCNLVNGACPGLPDHVMREFTDRRQRGVAVGLSAYTTPNQHQCPKDFAADGFPLTSDLTIFCGTGFELLNVLNTLCVDILIVIGGGVGTLLEAATAVEQEIPVLCLSPSGGIATMARDLLYKFIADFKSFSISDAKSVDDLSEQLTGFATKFRSAGRHSKLSALMQAVAREQARADDRLEIIVPTDISTISYRYRSTDITLRSPVLMTDRVRISRIPGKGETVNYALQKAQRLYILSNTRVMFTPTQGISTWGPSIDSLMLLDTVTNGIDISGAQSVLEIGCGSGVLAVNIAQRGHIKTVLGIDISEAALACAERNARLNDVDEKLELRQQDYWDLPRKRSFDLIVANPPYIPIAPSLGRTATEYAGTELLYGILSTYQHHLAEGGQCLLILSSASLVDPRLSSTVRTLEQSGQARKLGNRLAPFNVSEVLLSNDWLDWLLAGQGIFVAEDEDYRHWHRLEVWALVRR